MTSIEIVLLTLVDIWREHEKKKGLWCSFVCPQGHGYKDQSHEECEMEKITLGEEQKKRNSILDIKTNLKSYWVSCAYFELRLIKKLKGFLMKAEKKLFAGQRQTVNLKRRSL